MRVLISVLVATFVFLFASQAALASKQPAAEDSLSLGEELVCQLWADMKVRDFEAIEKYIAPGFLSVHQDGARSRDEELELIKNLNIGEYTLSNFKVTENGPVLIVIYFVSVAETIAGKRLSSRPAARLSAFLETEDGWQWIAHANLKPLN